MLPEGCTCLLGHSRQMEQAIVKLLTNVRDTIDEGDGATKITLQVFAGDNVVYITAHNNHGRIRPDVLQRIFEPFKTTT